MVTREELKLRVYEEGACGHVVDSEETVAERRSTACITFLLS
jgi:hypothetical protein